MMEVGIYLPTEMAWRTSAATKVKAEGLEGYFTLLPRHIDYVAVLVPGILTVAEAGGGVIFFAVDHGTLLKSGAVIHISTRNCVQGEDLDSLAAVVADKFHVLDDLERKARTALTGLEHTMLRRFTEMKKG